MPLVKGKITVQAELNTETIPPQITSESTDELILLDTNDDLYRISKEDFLANISTGFEVPTTIKTTAANDDYFIGIDSNGELYKITKANLLAGLSGGSNEPVNLTFASNGDTNGLFYYLGTNEGSTSWVNPQTLGAIELVASSGTIPISSLTNRTLENWYTGDVSNSWLLIDLKDNNLTLNKYSIRHDNEVGYYLRNWKLQGSNNVASNNATGVNNATWTDLSTRVNDTTLNAQGAWGNWDVSTTTAYRWLRILQTGLNSSNNNYLVMGEIELYGVLEQA